MSNADPNLRWDGQQWLHWDGVAWRPAGHTPQAPAQPSSPAAYHQPAAVAYPQVTYVPPGMVLTDQRPKNTEAVIAWILTVLTLFYFLPWAIAATRGKSNSGMVGLINFLVGWTFVGWVVALVMACTPHQVVGAAPTTVIHHTNYPPAQPSFAPPTTGFVSPAPLASPPDWPTPSVPSPEQRTAVWESPPS